MAVLTLNELKERKEPSRIMLVQPDFYDVIDVKNPYMTGEIVDHKQARQQWQSLVEVYESYCGDGNVLEEVVTLDAGEGLEDMVFCANQSLPFQDAQGKNHVLMSNMKHDSRKKEVPYFEDFYQNRGYVIHHVEQSVLLEGMGDCIFHPFKQLLWMGYGFRTDIKTADLLQAEMGIPVVPLKLVSPYFYHLDTCFVPVNERVVILCKEAFDEDSFQQIKSIFEEVIEISRVDAIATFALNTHCIYNKNQSVALVPKGSTGMMEILKSYQFKIHEMDTSEFIKGGGSVFCMKMMFH
jgi:N-dimethylarginine dimethylaminohydrolase